MRILSLALIAAAIPSAHAQNVSEARLRADIDTLVSFGTRHTLSSQTDPKRGIGAALNWAERELGKVAKNCGGCLTIAKPETMVTGARVPTPTRLVNVLAIQEGSERPNEVVIMAAHIDSRVSDVMDAVKDAPGANDNGSGTVAVIEAARILSKRQFPTTIVYAILSGEEQGLLGGKLLADYAKAQGWTVKAVLNNDIIGGSRGSDGKVDAAHVRVFSEGPRADADDAARRAVRSQGGENDSPSRNLSRWLAALAPVSNGGVAVRQVWRSDRMGRGGDHLPMLEAGYPAIRFSVAIEDYEHQHQDLRTENGVTYGDTADEMDFAYLARVTALNIAALDRLAQVPMPPVAKTTAAVVTYTQIDWTPVAGATGYALYRRATDARDWEEVVRVGPDVTSHRFDGQRGDDWFMGIASVGRDGMVGAVASAVPAGAYQPVRR